MVRIDLLKVEYINWLCRIVGFDGGHKYSKLIGYMFNKSFRWPIKKDYNRAYEGLHLRELYCKEIDIARFEFDRIFIDLESVSVLEVLVGLGIRCRDMSNPELTENTSWFMVFLKNLQLDYYDNLNFYVEDIDNILEKFINRKYEKNGNGGIFPLKNPKKDQKDLELWYQMCFYLDENYAF